MNADALIILIYVLVLASYLGFELIAKVPPTLHYCLCHSRFWVR